MIVFCVYVTSGLFFPKKTYKEPVPIGEGAFVDVLVTHVAAPDEIYVQKVFHFDFDLINILFLLAIFKTHCQTNRCGEELMYKEMCGNRVIKLRRHKN